VRPVHPPAGRKTKLERESLNRIVSRFFGPRGTRNRSLRLEL
jgi:hypothetical protein